MCSSRDCLFDLCADQETASLRCDSFEVYALACQEAGVKLGKWRQQLGCGKTRARTHTHTQKESWDMLKTHFQFTNAY